MFGRDGLYCIGLVNTVCLGSVSFLILFSSFLVISFNWVISIVYVVRLVKYINLRLVMIIDNKYCSYR